MTTLSGPPIRTLDDALDLLGRIDTQSIRYEQRKLIAIRGWALAHLGVDFEVGDRVEIARAPNCENGWSPYREALAEAATAVVQLIDFNSAHGYWYADIVLDREWSVSSSPFHANEVSRRWHGPVQETPEGMLPPSAYEQENHPTGRRHTFAMSVELLRKHQASAPSVRVSG